MHSNLSFVPFLPIRLIQSMFGFLVPLYNVYLSQAHLLAVILRLKSVFVHIASDSLLIFPVDSIPKVEYRNEPGIFDSFLSLAPPIQMRRHPQKQRNVFIIMGRLECSARIIKYAGVQLFVTIIIIKNTYFSCVYDAVDSSCLFHLYLIRLLFGNIMIRYTAYGRQNSSSNSNWPRH